MLIKKKKMGCECLKIKKIENEIINPNIHKKHISLKNKKIDKERNTDTYINSMKTSDKNTEIIQNINQDVNTIYKNQKIDHSKYDSNIISTKITVEKTFNEIKKKPTNFY